MKKNGLHSCIVFLSGFRFFAFMTHGNSGWSYFAIANSAVLGKFKVPSTAGSEGYEPASIECLPDV